uniref:Uncharacterized protein n=1 Tax=Anguilla anguilla TaxID=7936 RepID=A0A0E9X759_ANGAN
MHITISNMFSDTGCLHFPLYNHLPTITIHRPQKRIQIKKYFHFQKAVMYQHIKWKLYHISLFVGCFCIFYIVNSKLNCISVSLP